MRVMRRAPRGGDRENAKSQGGACGELEKEEANRLTPVSLASALGYAYGAVISYYQVVIVRS